MFVPILLFFTLLFLPATVPADQSVADIEALLKEIPEGDKPELQKLRDSYSQALQLVREGERYRSQTDSLRKFMDEFPAALKKLEQQKASLKQTTTENIALLDGVDLDQALVDAQARRLELRRQREELTNTLNLQELSSSGVHSQLDELRQQLRQTQQTLDQQQFTENPSRQQNANRILTMVQEQTLQRRLQMLELEQLSAGNRDTLNKLRLDILQSRLNDLEQYIDALQNRQNELRRATTEAAIAESERLLDEVETSSPLLAREQERNQQLSSALAERSRTIEALQLENQTVENAVSELSTLKSNLKEQLEWLEISRGFGENLRNRLSELPASYPLRQLEARIVQSRVDRYGYQEALDDINNHIYRNRLLTQEQELNEEQQLLLDELLNTRARLLERLLSVTDKEIHEQTRLKVAYSRQNSQLDEIRTLTDERLFWLPDLRPIGSSFPAAMMETLDWLARTATWTALPRALQQQSGASLTLYGISTMVVLYLWLLSRRSQKDYLERIHSRIGNVTLDKYGYTFNTLLLSLLTAVPIPALLSLLSHAIDSPLASPIVVSLSVALRALMLPVFILLLVGNLTQPKGLLVMHFNLPAERVRKVWRQFRALMLSLLPMLLLFYTAKEFREFSLYDTLGRLAFIYLCVLLSLFSWRLYRQDMPLLVSAPQKEHLTLANHLLWGLLIIAPLLAGAAATMGYLFTAHTLLRQLEISVLAGLGFVMAYYSVRRWMLLQRRRLAFERAKARRAEILAQRKEKERDEPQETPPSPEAEAAAVAEVDLDAISAQSLGLLRSVLMLGYILTLMLLWSEINTAFSFLDSINVWHVSSSLAGEDTLVPISLKDLVLTLFLAIMTLITARNLPGLMELSVLQHLNLSPGTGFAITTISKYLVLLFGAFATFAMLGIDWSKLQWLVAALSVGLGFGLQEIFANFVSGLIILFEKPIRIGDTVTIRDLTGTISKIKTRATTIVDWDRREIIVPNKAFITEQFINWSLSDAITRVKLYVRVRLDADVETVQQLLQDAISECSLILDNPVPEAFLIELTDSALVYEVRVYVNDMGHRMPMTHELHNLLLERLRRHDIRIPHQQVDIRLVGEQGQAVAKENNNR